MTIKALFLRNLLAGLFLLGMLALPVGAGAKYIVVQSTTSTQNSGLLDFILPLFKSQTGISVRVVAVGTGQALKNGRNGDGDVLLVHAKQAEEKFVAEDYGVSRKDVMYNDFVLVGPAADPAGVSGTSNILSALTKVSKTAAKFVSRGDDSGTNKKELALWRKAGVNTQAGDHRWYLETGSGMGATLNVAAGMGAYTLTDRGTWIAFKNKKSLRILSSGDPLLFNQYGVILVNAKRHPHVKTRLATTFINWLTGKQGQAAIAAYRLDGQQLFFPNAKQSH